MISFRRLIFASFILAAFVLTATALVVTQSYLASTAKAAGIFTLKGKLKSFTEDKYIIQTKTMIYDIRKADLIKEQVEELKTKKAGQDVDLVVSTEAVAAVRDL